MTSNIFIHVGLPKTATTFLQKYVFQNLDDSLIVYNPKKIIENIFLSFQQEINREQLVEIKKNIDMEIIKYNGKKILISNEDISVEKYDLRNTDEIKIIKYFFPDAEIFLMLRYQPDWCLSLYKQSIQQFCVQDIEDFLNYKNSEFVINYNTCLDKYRPKINAANIDYSRLIRIYIESYSKNNVHIYFFEDFKNNNQKIIDNICKVMGVTNKKCTYKVHYKGLSALSIKILVAIYKTCRFLKINIPYRYDYSEQISFSSSYLEIKKNRQYYKLPYLVLYKIYLRVMKSITWISLRDFMQNYFDNLIYIDWDLLEKNNIRKKLTKKYYDINQELKIYISEEKIPKIYFLK